MPSSLHFIIVATVAYAIGCINTGYYLVRLLTDQDIRTMGSGSTGARNVSRSLGRQGFLFTFAGDTLKAVLAVAIPRYLHLGQSVELIAVLAVVAGHIWPVQLAFNGGKGICTAFGAMMVYNYWFVLVYLVITMALYPLLRKSSTAGIAAFVSLPFISIAMHRNNWGETIAMTLMTSLLLVAHRDNIRILARPSTGPAPTPPSTT